MSRSIQYGSHVHGIYYVESEWSMLSVRYQRLSINPLLAIIAIIVIALTQMHVYATGVTVLCIGRFYLVAAHLDNTQMTF